ERPTIHALGLRLITKKCLPGFELLGVTEDENVRACGVLGSFRLTLFETHGEESGFHDGAAAKRLLREGNTLNREEFLSVHGFVHGDQVGLEALDQIGCVERDENGLHADSNSIPASACRLVREDKSMKTCEI